MTRHKVVMFAGLLALALAPAVAGAQPTPPASGTYVGARKCKNCHAKAHNGDQWGAWKKAAHSKAFATLATAKAKEVAAKQGIADPQQATECLGCHVTAAGVDAKRLSKPLAKKGAQRHAEGVGCETCHGPGKAHLKARFAAAGEDADDGTKAQPRAVVPKGEILAAPNNAVCVSCHNEKSPTYKPFDCAERVGPIAHSDPRRARTPAEVVKAVCGK